jgi:hypothetical protein
MEFKLWTTAEGWVVMIDERAITRRFDGRERQDERELGVEMSRKNSE